MDGNTPVYLQLQWFDTVEEVRVSSELRNKRWNTEVAARDMLYLEKLGGGVYPINVFSAYYTTFRLKMLLRASSFVDFLDISIHTLI